MEFVSWVEETVRSDKKLPACRRDGDTVELFEKNSNVDMTVRVEDVPESTVVISPEDAKKWELFHADRPKDWMKRCDYLLVGKTECRYFAIFVELKKRIPGENDSAPEKNGYPQLCWSQPLLHYLLSVFNIDSRSNLTRSEFCVKFWQIGQYPAGDHVKSRVYLGDGEEVYFVGKYKGLTIHNRVAPVVSLKDLLEF